MGERGAVPDGTYSYRPGLDVLLARALSLRRAGQRRVLGIVGPPGVGKSTLAEQVESRVVPTNAHIEPADSPAPSASLVPMDGFHLADVELRRLGRLDRKGAPDTFDHDGYRALLTRVRARADPLVYAPAFDRRIGEPVAGSIPVWRDTPLIVTEGNYLLLTDFGWAGVRALVDEVWYCTAPEDERMARLVARHEEAGKSSEDARRYAMDVDRANAQTIELGRDGADLVVSCYPGPAVR